MKESSLEYESKELSREESSQLKGGSFLYAIALGMAVKMAWEIYDHPDDVKDGFLDAFN